ncbi:anti-sigma factor [Gordonia sp. CPCC 206044]|uniref:anti-sigma factor n=1 Tax=Gordonia sp. CPCC 206044 TaxID=3140793 RepID=UPI003AF3633B
MPIIRSVVERALFLDDWSIDDVADVKLGVDEICTQLGVLAEPGGRLDVSLQVGKQGVVCQVDGTVDAGGVLDTSGFGWHVVQTVTDAQSVGYSDSDDGRRGISVRFAKWRNGL